MMPDMSSKRIDLGELSITTNENIAPGDVWIGPAGDGPSPRLLDAFARGEVTEGGLAEAGWRVLGKVVGDGPTFEPRA